MKEKFVFILLFFVSVMFGQSPKDRIMYLDTLERTVPKGQHDFIRVMKNYYSDLRHCSIYDYYKSGKAKMLGTLSDKYAMRKTGPFVTYYENGTRESIIHFLEDNPIEKCYFWYEKGMKKAEGEFVKVKRGDEPVMKINQYWSRIGIQRIIDGKGHFLDEDITSASEGELFNGLKEGEWYGTDYKGNFIFTEKYKKGKLVSGISTDSLNQNHPYKKIYSEAIPIKGVDHFYNYIERELKRGQTIKASKIYATIVVGFTIDKNGVLKDITILNDADKTVDGDIIKIFERYGAWVPAQSRGINTGVSMTIPIYMKLY